MLTRRLWKIVAGPVGRGFDPPVPGDLEPRWWRTGASGQLVESAAPELPQALTAACGGGVAFILPTALRRSRKTLAQRVNSLRKQVAQASRENDLPALLVIGLQWFEGEEDEALELLRHALGEDESDGARESEVAVLGLTLRGPGKVETLRICLPLLNSLELDALGWVDDDIHLDPGCLSRLVAGYRDRNGGPCVLGATKIPHRRESRASQWLFILKKHMDPAVNYPHGCCMLVDASLFDRGIPDRYCCDDGYFCYEMLQRAPDEAEWRLALVPDSRCHYEVGAARGRLIPRLRRLLLNHVIFLADYPPEVGAKYLSDYLYPGFWPLSRTPTESGGRSGPARWALQAFHLLCLSTIISELAVRGLIGRPLREIRWAS